jgi:hypothetical protein
MPINWSDPNWGHNPVHVSESGSHLDAEPGGEDS